MHEAVRYSCTMHEATSKDISYVHVAGEPHMLLSDVLQKLGINRRTAYRWRDRGKLTHRHYLGRVCCPVSEVLRLEFQQEVSHDGS